MRTVLAAAALVVAVFAGGCAGSRTDNPFQGGAQGERSIRVEVRNLNFADATLYAYRGSERIRMGIVTGKTDAEFTVPWTVTVPLRIEIDLLAGDRCITRPMSVDPGDVIQVQIEIDLRSSLDCNGPLETAAATRPLRTPGIPAEEGRR